MSRNDWIMVIVGLIAYQVYATVIVIKSEDFDDDVKRKQVIFIWLVPIVGAMLVRMRVHAALRERVLRSDPKPGAAGSPGTGPSPGTAPGSESGPASSSEAGPTSSPGPSQKQGPGPK